MNKTYNTHEIVTLVNKIDFHTEKKNTYKHVGIFLT